MQTYLYALRECGFWPVKILILISNTSFYSPCIIRTPGQGHQKEEGSTFLLMPLYSIKRSVDNVVRLEASVGYQMMLLKISSANSTFLRRVSLKFLHTFNNGRK